MNKFLKYFLITTLVIGCKNSIIGNAGNLSFDESDSNFPSLVSLDTVSSTEFVPTLENPLPENKNVVYTPAFLYAWDELRQQAKGKILVEKRSEELDMVDQSVSYKGTLDPGEYTMAVSRKGEKLEISASFKKGLQFKKDFDTLGDGVTFNGSLVKAFGMPEYSSKLAEQIEILYYESDDKFILNIDTKDDKEQIILAKGFGSNGTFSQILKTINECIETEKRDKEHAKDTDSWKYYLRDGDAVVIPIIAFNYLVNYSDLTGQNITAGGKQLLITKACQRNALVLNQHGAKVESDAEVSVSADSGSTPSENIDHCKKLLLNKNFVFILKKTKSQYPYFMMSVANTDIMLKR